MSYSVMSVSQLNRYVKSLLDGDQNISNIYVKGEISNFKCNYSSGHMYFSLKDQDAVIRCALFRNDAARLRFVPENDMSVICRGRVSIYERDGTYQLYVTQMQPDGVGALALAFEQVKKKLSSEGLFDEKLKRPLPSYPKKIAVLTSENGAAVRDILSITERRYPICEILLCSVSVQGEYAAESIINALYSVYKRDDVDLIIVGRGGGSAEDLAAFNDEQLARVISRSPVPVVSAVGHETDYTICDFVADLRAPTPSAAAELCVPDSLELLQYISSLKGALNSLINGKISGYEAVLDGYKKSTVFGSPERLFEGVSQRFDYLFSDFCKSFELLLSKDEMRFKNCVDRLKMLNPLGVLSRGYAVVKKSGNTVSSKSQLSAGDVVSLTLKDGDVSCRVLEGEDN
ncbi:MAG: exodeoxyribonuclease VII large subunit [bacterium]|nr:exodeoxyribonuclease VII large subunit [bacterium]